MAKNQAEAPPGDGVTVSSARAEADAYGSLTRNRDVMVARWHRAGLSKSEIYRRTGIARTTLDRILAEAP